MQVDPTIPTLKPLRDKRLKLEHEKMVFTFAFKFNLRRYTAVAAVAMRVAAARGGVRVASRGAELT